MTTKQLEHNIYFTLAKVGTYLCFEIMMPFEYRPGISNERVDLLQFNSDYTWRFYELKVSKSDFYSKAAHTFHGHYNYYVMPVELYDQVKHDIPCHVGCYVSFEDGCKCYKRATKQDLKIPHDKLMFSFMQGLSRENKKYRCHLYSESKRLLEVSK